MVNVPCTERPESNHWTPTPNVPSEITRSINVLHGSRALNERPERSAHERVLSMARQSGRERRGDQDEKRQPYQNMIAPSPHQRKPLLIVPPCDCRGAAISSRRIGCRQRPSSV